MLSLRRQYRYRRDLRHLKALGVPQHVEPVRVGVLCAESCPTGAKYGTTVAAVYWQSSGMHYKVCTCPLVLAALHRWKGRRLYLALDTTVLWNRYCMIHLTVTCCGQAVPLLWRVLEHPSATVSTARYLPLLRFAHRLLQGYSDGMVLADQGVANHDLLE